MFNFFKKGRNQKNRSTNISETTDTVVIPNARETLEVSKQKWKNITSKEILKEIQYESSQGNRKASFFDCYISEELVNELRTQGYRVEITLDSQVIGPHFNVYW